MELRRGTPTATAIDQYVAHNVMKKNLTRKLTNYSLSEYGMKLPVGTIETNTSPRKDEPPLIYTVGYGQ